MDELLTAITRQPSPALSSCELVHLQRQSVDQQLANQQYEAYRDCLTSLGVTVRELDPLPDHPDAIFVEDCALVLDEVAVLTRPGAHSRRSEVASLAPILAEYREVLRIEEPACIDGGDLLLFDKRIFCGLSQRSNQEGVDQLHALLGPFGYSIEGLKVEHCLHLKSAASYLDDVRVLANPDWIDVRALGSVEITPVHPDEPYGANVLPLAGSLVCSKAYPQTNQILRQLGYRLEELDLSELHKMEAAVTCPSLVFKTISVTRSSPP